MGALVSIPCRTTDELRQMLADARVSLAELAPYNGTAPGARAIGDVLRVRDIVRRELERRGEVWSE